MRFHVVSLPHTQTTSDFAACAYTAKVRNFCAMMKSRGHHVTLYSGEANDAPCDEHVVCISERERAAVVGADHYTAASFDYHLPHWLAFNGRAAAGIALRKRSRDFICLIAGRAHKAIADAHPDLPAVEFGIGYGGSFSKYRVWESYAWMHTCYGAEHPRDPHSVNGQWFDAVIPGYLDPDQFPAKCGDTCRVDGHKLWEILPGQSAACGVPGPCGDCASKGGDYFLYVGRMIERKGIHIAAQLCAKAGRRLVMAGPGTPPAGVEYAGVVGPEERGRLMAGARALIMPTIYIEPFGNVAIEAMACGTPVICTDWGAMTETVIEGVTGFRCRTFAEFLSAMEKVGDLDPGAIRGHVVRNYSLPVIAEKYERHFERLAQLWSAEGWYLDGRSAA